MYQNILLDLDDTILDFGASETFAFQQVAENLGVTYDTVLLEDYKRYNQSLWLQIERNTLTKADLIDQRFPGFFSRYGLTNLSGNDIDNQFRAYLADGGHIIPGARQLLIDLKASGRKIYAASNGIYDTQINRLEQAGLINFFDDLFISEKIGYNKPHVGFFDYTFETIGLEAKHSSIMVGDSLTSDIKGANAAQIPAVWFNPKGLIAPCELRIDYEITTLDQLYPIIDL